MDAAVKTNGSYTLKIVHDEDSINPREDYDNFGHMACWHKRYNLGDKHGHENPGDFLAELVRNTVPAQDVIAYVKDGKASGLKLEYDKSRREWDLSSYDGFFKKWFDAGNYAAPQRNADARSAAFAEDESADHAPLDQESVYLCDAILENMASRDLMELAKRNHLIMPLYLLDHSGITISTSDFHDKWDSGQVGWTYASLDDVKKEYGNASPENIEKAERLLESEVETYDCYLRGECYGFELYENGELADSCWGFLGRFDEALKSIREYLPEEVVPLADSAEYGDDESEYDEDMDMDDEM